MGFSPGDFISNEKEVHWELKDGPRVVLWNADESIRIMSLDTKEDIRRAYDQLRLLVVMSGCE